MNQIWLISCVFLIVNCFVPVLIHGTPVDGNHGIGDGPPQSAKNVDDSGENSDITKSDLDIIPNLDDNAIDQPGGEPPKDDSALSDTNGLTPVPTLSSSAAPESEKKPETVGSSDVEQNNNCTENNTECSNSGSTFPFNFNLEDNKPMLMRTFYVILGITGIVIVYFLVRTVRTRRRQSRTKRYGLLATKDDLEMAPLDMDDDDDDMTVFDINNPK